MRKLGIVKPKPIIAMAGGDDTVAAADEPMETNLKPDAFIGIKRERPIRKAAAAASQRIIDVSSPTKKSTPTKNTVVIQDNDTIITDSNKKKRKRAGVIPCVEESWEKAAISKNSSKNMSKIVAKYNGKLFREKVKGVWEERVIIGVFWNSEHSQYIVNTDLTSGMDEAEEYSVLSVRKLII